MTLGSCLGSYFQRILPSLLRSSAKTVFGNGAWRNITSPMTSGAPSCPRKTPVEKVQAGAILWTLSVLICLSSEYLVLAKLPAGITHWFGSAAIFASSSFATAYPAVNRAAAPKQLASKILRIVSSRLDSYRKAQPQPITGQSALQRQSQWDGFGSVSRHGETSRRSRGFALSPKSAPGLPFPNARAVETNGRISRSNFERKRQTH